MTVIRTFLLVFLLLLLSVLSSPTDAQTTIVVDPATGMTVTITEGQPLAGINTNPNATSVYTGDDGVAQVPLPFAFPFYDEEFINSWMYTNGAISFTGQSGSFCCNGENLDIVNQNGSMRYNYSILPLWADLWSNRGQMYYLGTEESMTYGWYGVTEYGTSRENSFEVELHNNGDIDMAYGNADLAYHDVTIGLVGDMSQGQYQQFYNGHGYNLGSTITVPNVCDSNPLASPECPGYQEAYFAQQCSSNPLYSPACPGYQQAYFTQQCMANPLYSDQCPGYQEAYYTQQCEQNPLFDSGCVGYEQAYYDQQCSVNALYDSQCPGYQEAYYDQQCSIDPLYDSGCNGYQNAYYAQQCSINPLYDSQCPGYQKAYYDKQCSENPLYDSQCPGYQEAYVKTYIITVDPVTEEVTATETLEEFLSVESTPDLSSYTQEVIPGMQTETVTVVVETVIEEKKSNEEIVSEVLGPSTKKENTDKKKQQIASKIAELKAELTSVKDPKKQEELQTTIAALMSYVPGFDVYYVALPDSPFYQQEQVYQNQKVPENTSGLRMGLASELKYDEMIQMQYNRSP